MSKEIIIFQPGKVGSTTILTHLRDVYELNNTQLISCPINNDRYPLNLSHNIYHSHHENTLPKDLRNKIIDTNETIHFICMSRDPISRNISSFFEMPHYKHMLGRKPTELGNYFIENFDHKIGLRWYEKRIEQYLGFNLYNTPFNFEKGYQIYENDNKKLLFVRSEDMTTNINNGLSELLDENINKNLINRNITVDKYGGYDEFKKHLKVPKNILDELYNNKHIEHFYTSEEIKNMRIKWEI